MPGFKALNRTGITLASGGQVALDLPLEVGAIEESITVTGEAPLLETTSVRAGLNLTTKELEELPTMSNMPVMLARYAPGLSANPTVGLSVQGFVQGPSETVAPLGGVGGAEYSIDGATNNGVGRRMATSPNADMIQEMRVETTTFTAATGHGVGVGISLMTRAGTNQRRGTLNHQFWTNKINAPRYFQRETFAIDKDLKDAYESGTGNDFAATYGGPVKIPKVIDGTNKLFMFLNLSLTSDTTRGGNRITLPRSDPGHNHVAGDFSDLLLLPNPAQYIIYARCDAPRSRAAGTRDSRCVPEQHHSGGPDQESLLQDVHGLPAHTELQPGGQRGAVEQLRHCGPTGPESKPDLGRANRLQPVGEPTGTLCASPAATSTRETRGTGRFRVENPKSSTRRTGCGRRPSAEPATGPTYGGTRYLDAQ